MTSDLFNPQLLNLPEIHYPDNIPEHVARLHLMENPYPLPENLQHKIHKKLQNLSLNRYPDPNMSELKQTLKKTFDIPEQSDIILGNGSFELLQNVFLALMNNKQCFLAPAPSFFFFQRQTHLLNQQLIGVPLEKDIIAAMKQHQPSLVIIDNPNNPMGTIMNETTLEQIIQATPGFVLIDEAYFHYGRVTMMPYLSKYPNLLISRSLSKAGLAGLRLGYLCCHPDMAATINKVSLPFNINTYTAAAAEIALDYFSVVDEQIQQIIADRNALFSDMKVILGDNVSPSHTNFINFKIPGCDAESVFNEFLTRDILLFFYRVKPPHPLENHLRVTVGTPDENKKFLTTLIEIKHVTQKKITQSSEIQT